MLCPQVSEPKPRASDRSPPKVARGSIAASYPLNFAGKAIQTGWTPCRHSFAKIVRQTTVPWGLTALALHSLVVRVAASNSAPDAMQELN